MRSGTHLAIDLLLNNVAGYRQSPLYLDFDSYVFEGFSLGALRSAGSCIVKTHVTHRPFSAEAKAALRQLGDRSVVIVPVRGLEKIQRSLGNFGYGASTDELDRLHRQHLEFWKDHHPLLVDFDTFLDPEKAAVFLAEVRERAGLPPAAGGTRPFVAGSSRRKNLWRKLLTRLKADKASRINTTVGFKL